MQETAANTYGVDEDSVSENLIKINVYFTSLNEKLVEDVIDYSFEVKGLVNEQLVRDMIDYNTGVR